jgi:small subunit ribosomal protein S3
MLKIEQKFGLQNPQISVLEVANPELNPHIMCNRIAQLIERGTAFRRAAMWSLNTIMNAGALGVEVVISGKLRTERAHFEKHTVGVVPKSGDIADQMVTTGVSHVLTKMGLMGIQLRIASRAALPQEFELKDGSASAQATTESPPAAKGEGSGSAAEIVAEQPEGGKQDGQA